MRATVYAALLVAGATMAAASGPGEDPGGGWRDGPVRYLLTEDEYRRFGELDGPEERSDFVRRFWARLDPDPFTSANEYRERFERLCEEANRRFGSPGQPGWKSDRGQVWIILGEPDAVRHEVGDAWSSAREVWTYERPPGGGAGPLEILFHRERGEWRLRTEDRKEIARREDPVRAQAERIRRWYHERQWRLGGLVPWLDDGVSIPSLSGSLSSRAPEPTPPPDYAFAPQRGTKDRSAEVAPPLLDMEERAYFFRASDDSILTFLAIDIGRDSIEGPSPDAAGAAVRLAETRAATTPGQAPWSRTIELQGRPFTAGPARLFFTGRAYLEPGTYEASFAVEDRSAQRLAVRRRTIEVPRLAAGRFSASSVVPALRFGPVIDGQATPFAAGSEEVVPRPGGLFRRGEALQVYLQHYGAAPDPETGRPSVDVTFRFERDGDARFHPRAGRSWRFPRVEGESVGLALPIPDWPDGRYRVFVELTDRVSGATTFSEGEFRISP